VEEVVQVYVLIKVGGGLYLFAVCLFGLFVYSFIHSGVAFSYIPPFEQAFWLGYLSVVSRGGGKKDS
jgi:hypothetical protein